MVVLLVLDDVLVLDDDVVLLLVVPGNEVLVLVLGGVAAVDGTVVGDASFVTDEQAMQVAASPTASAVSGERCMVGGTA